MDEFNPGDIVYLRSGSPKMTVIKVDGVGTRWITVVWVAYGKSKMEERCLPSFAFKRA